MPCSPFPRRAARASAGAPRVTALLLALAALGATGRVLADGVPPASGKTALPTPAAPGLSLPAAISTALARAALPSSALALWVQPVDAATPAWGLNSDAGMNPASVFKLVTTAAALDLLGPSWHWQTPVSFTGRLLGDVLHGTLAIRGSGDPSLVLERVWLLLKQVRAAGVREIRGDIVLDHQAFAPAAHAAADFDGAPSEPYNVQPDALLLNYKAVTLHFAPDVAAQVARVVAEPELADVRADATLPLADGACEDWRAALKLATDDPARWHAGGRFATRCGPRSWPLAYADPASYDARLVEALWHEVGGTLKGRVRDGATPADARTAFDFASPPLAEVVRDINKYSNNVMAEQLFLTLAALGAPQGRGAAAPEAPPAAGNALMTSATDRRQGPPAAASPAPTSVLPLPPSVPGTDTPSSLAAVPPTSDASATVPGATPEQARALLGQWLHARLGNVADGTVIVNGSGLARETRISARTLGTLLQWLWRSPVMPELMSSLPLNGIDGTLRRSAAPPGRAHLKTGSLRDVNAVAGYVLAESGRRYVLVAIVNDPRAAAARPVLDAAIDWVERDFEPPAR